MNILFRWLNRGSGLVYLGNQQTIIQNRTAVTITNYLSWKGRCKPTVPLSNEFTKKFSIGIQFIIIYWIIIESVILHGNGEIGQLGLIEGP